MIESLWESDPAPSDRFWVTDLRIVATLDANLQTRGQCAIWRAGLKSGSDYVLVMPSVDPSTGDVTRMITSRRYGYADGESVDALFTKAYAGAGST